MKQLNTQFILTNILAAVFLVFFSSSWKSLYQEIESTGQNYWYGQFIYIVALIGIISAYWKAYELSRKRRKALRWFEQIFTILLYLFAMIGFMLMLDASIDMSYNRSDYMYRELLSKIAFPFFTAFGFLMVEAFYLNHPPKKELSAFKKQFSEYGYSLYSSTGISVCWNALVFGSGLKFHSNIFLAVLQQIILMIVLVFPFQRLFWFEIFSTVETRLEYFKVFLSFLLVLLSGIMPFWVSL